MSKVKVAVVILNWNGEGYLKQFMPNVCKYSQGEGVEVWVVDNGSTDGSLELLRNNFPSVKLLEFSINYGFTGGYNRALALISAEFYVLLNSDVEVTPNWISPIIDKMDSDATIAAAMPKLLSYNDKNYFEYAGAAGGFIDKYGFPFCRGRILSEIEKDNGQYNTESEIFWATGACFFVRSSIYNEVGGLDEQFFAHMEEIDLCWRMKNRGHKIMYYPQSVVYHVGGGTLPNNNPRKLFLNYRNNLLLLYKNLPTKRLSYIMLMRLILDGISSALYFVQGKFSFCFAVYKAHLSFYFMLFSFVHKRKENKALRIVQTHKEMLYGSIVYSFFINKLRKFPDLKL